MRKDMKDLIIEADRGTSEMDDPRGRIKQQDPETLPEQEGIRRRYKGWGPTPGDRLGPLRRFLHSRVGQKWDKVYSEICEQADDRSLRGWHLRDHVKMEVETKPDPRRKWFYKQFYVDGGGFLRERKDRRPSWRNRHREQDPDKCMVGNARFERINGCWFQVWYEKTTVPHRRWSFLDQKHIIEYVTEEVLDRKKQLNAKELRDFGLSNDPGWKWYE